MVLRAGLDLGVELDRPQARRVAQELRQHTSMAAAQKSLRTRDLTEGELHSRLAKAGVAPAAREETVGRLVGARVVDDLRFARSRAETLAARGAGDLLIRDDLEGRGIDGEVIEAALAELEPEPLRARQLVAKLGSGPRAVRRLARKGFADDVIQSLCEEPVAEDAPPAVR